VPDNDPCNYASPNAAKNTGAPNVLLPCGSASGTRKGKGANGKSSNKKKGDDLWIGNKLNLFCPIRERRINVLI
jgi:hypothetical protein